MKTNAMLSELKTRYKTGTNPCYINGLYYGTAQEYRNQKTGLYVEIFPTGRKLPYPNGHLREYDVVIDKGFPRAVDTVFFVRFKDAVKIAFEALNQ